MTRDTDLPEPLPEEEPGEWGDPIPVKISDEPLHSPRDTEQLPSDESISPVQGEDDVPVSWDEPLKSSRDTEELPPTEDTEPLATDDTDEPLHSSRESDA